MEIDDQSVLEAASWRLASDLVRRHPAALSVSYVEPGGGPGDCLVVLAPTGGPGRIELDRNGSIRVLERFDGGPVEDASIGWDECVAADPLELVERLGRAAGLPAPVAPPVASPESLAVRVLAAIAATAFKSRPPIAVRPGFLDSPGDASGPNPGLERFPSLHRGRDSSASVDEDATAGQEWWVVERGGEPVLVIRAPTAEAWTPTGDDPIDLGQLGTEAGGDDVLVALELLVAAGTRTGAGGGASSVSASPTGWGDQRA